MVFAYYIKYSTICSEQKYEHDQQNIAQTQPLLLKLKQISKSINLPGAGGVCGAIGFDVSSVNSCTIYLHLSTNSISDMGYKVFF